MSKKKKRNLKTNPKPLAASVSQERVEGSERSAEERPMDFGGLPARDLKKNLGGCG